MTGVVLHHRLEGYAAGDVLVMSGSLGSDLTMWDPQVAALGQRFGILRHDHRGHGDSPVPPGPYTIAELGGDVIALLDALGIARAHFCGLSLGGMVGMWLAANAPDRIRGLVLCCTTAAHGSPSAWQDRAALVRRKGMGAVADSVVQRWFTQEHAHRNPGLVAAMRQMVVRTSAEGYAGCCEAIATMTVEADLDRIIAPTLVVAGADDPATPPEMGRALADRIPHARLTVIEGAAHLANVEQPDRVSHLLACHLAAAEGAPQP